MSEIPEMTGEVAQAGVATQAGVAAQTDTAAHGSTVAADGHTAEGCCLNCGTVLVGTHCHACGQRAHVHRTLGAFLHDLVHGVLHFEGKFWRTLPLLAWQPGRLTREYIDGKRASYISPIALFLFTVFVSFALFNAAGGFGEGDMSLVNDASQQVEEGGTSLDISQTVDGAIADTRRKIAASKAAGRSTASLDEDLAQLIESRDFMLAAQPSVENGTSGDASANTANPDNSAGQWLQQIWQKAKANPKLLLYKLQTNAYKLSWLLIPLSVPFVWLLFPLSRKFRMYDHTVFVTYSISFMTMLVVIASIGAAYDLQLLIIAPAIYAPFHLYRSLRGAYSLTRFGAVWRTILLSAGCVTAMVLFAVIMFGLVLSG